MFVKKLSKKSFYFSFKFYHKIYDQKRVQKIYYYSKYLYNCYNN